MKTPVSMWEDKPVGQVGHKCCRSSGAQVGKVGQVAHFGSFNHHKMGQVGRCLLGQVRPSRFES